MFQTKRHRLFCFEVLCIYRVEQFLQRLLFQLFSSQKQIFFRHHPTGDADSDGIGVLGEEFADRITLNIKI